jgi:hypothetical protein
MLGPARSKPHGTAALRRIVDDNEKPAAVARIS